jgi:ribosomal protein L34
MRFKDVTGATHEATPSEVPFRPTIYVCVEHDEKLLMLIDERSGKWELPGGGLEVGEEVEEGAKREVKEETGYSVTVKPLPFHLMKEMFYFRTCQEYCTHSFFSMREHSCTKNKKRYHPLKKRRSSKSSGFLSTSLTNSRSSIITKRRSNVFSQPKINNFQ